MPRLSKQKKDKIAEQILYHLFSIAPESSFTNKIAEITARDEEFIKSLLIELEKKGLVVKITKNPEGIDYVKRQRWRLSNKAFDVYKKHQTHQPSSFSTSSTHTEKI